MQRIQRIQSPECHIQRCKLLTIIFVLLPRWSFKLFSAIDSLCELQLQEIQITFDVCKPYLLPVQLLKNSTERTFLTPSQEVPHIVKPFSLFIEDD
jgi:hypothetical protein